LAVEHERLGQVRRRAGSRATYTAPSNMYQTSDGVWITIVGSSEATFRRLCEAMGRAELLSDPTFSTNSQRIQNVDSIDGIVAAWCRKLSFTSLASTLDHHQVPFSKVYDITDILADPHFQARQVIMRLTDPEVGSVPAPCVVPRFSGYPSPELRSGPCVGEHNADVYGELGLSEVELQNLRNLKVI